MFLNLYNKKDRLEKFGNSKSYVFINRNINIKNGFSYYAENKKFFIDVLPKCIDMFRYKIENNPTFIEPIIKIIPIRRRDDKVFVTIEEDKYTIGYNSSILEKEIIDPYLYEILKRIINKDLKITYPKEVYINGIVQDKMLYYKDKIGLVTSISVNTCTTKLRKYKWYDLDMFFDDFHKFDPWSQKIIDYMYVKKKACFDKKKSLNISNLLT